MNGSFSWCPWTRSAGRLAVIGWACAVIQFFGCSSSPPELGSINTPPTGFHEHGAIVWHDLVTSDPDASRRFYAALFGWSFETPAEQGYDTISNAGRRIGGMIDARRHETGSDGAYWVSAISVDDVNAAAARVTEAGGRVLRGPVIAEKRGHLAIVSDPQGAVFCLVYSATGDPSMQQTDYAWLWHELVTPEPSDSIDFYTAALGYAPGRSGPGGGYRTLVSGGHSRAGVVSSPFLERSALWVPYVRCDDPDAVVRRAESLGATVLIRPDATIRDAGVALIQDPDGAIFAVQRWPLEGESS